MPVTKVTDRQGVALKWDEVDEEQEVTVYATGEEGDVHNKRPQKNDGRAGIFFPADFSGTAHVEVRDADGNVVSEGDVEV